MKTAIRQALRILIACCALLSCVARLHAEPLPLKRAVELALTHSSAAISASADERRAFESFNEARNQYIPQLVVGSGLGASWGFPLSLEGSAPSLLNVNAQSALINPALRDFIRAAKSDWSSASLQAKDQRSQIVQDTVLLYAELNKWESTLGHLHQEQADALKMEEVINRRVTEGVDSQLARNQGKLVSARVRLRVSQSQGAIDVLRSQLSHLTGLPASSIETIADSIPALPEIKQEEDLATKAVQSSFAVQGAEDHGIAQGLRARGEHRSLWPSVDFAAQYALLSQYNNYADFYKSFQRHNATVGVAIRFPFLNFSQRARARAADADALKAQKQAEAAKDHVSEETLKLQRSVEQLAAAQEVASLEYQVAQSGFDSVQVRMDSGTATVHDLDDARNQANERFHAMQNATFELQRGRVALLRVTGDLESWLGLAK
jgi:outer membrane protein TolC